MRRFLIRTWQLLWRRSRNERDATREIRAHLALMTADFEQRGLDPAQARRQAAIALGGVEQARQAHQSARGFAALEDLVRDFKHSARSLARARTFTLTAIATLAAAIGATTAIYSVVQSVLLDPLRYPQSQQLVSLRLVAPGNDMQRYRAHSRSQPRCTSPPANTTAALAPWAFGCLIVRS